MIHVCDDFFEDAYEVRRIALRQKYLDSEGAKILDHRYPGRRSWDVSEKIKNYITSYVRGITQNPFLEINRDNGCSFQSVDKLFDEGIYHKDKNSYIIIIYLSPDPPFNSGTEICDGDHIPDSIPDGLCIKLKESFIADPYNLIKRYRYARIRRKVNLHYKPIIKMPNKFNRSILFPAHNFHRAQNFFGSSLATSRLTLVSFLE
tara:strand:+ start:60 stop:671 length:612 start_codon:yes stop_codon:yes gene_type:complete